MPGQLDGKVALVTGGASGIGRASALTFAREGAQVVVADVDVAGGEETVRMIKETQHEALFVRTDVTRSREVEALIAQAVRTYGRLDCAFNNAGIAGAVAPVADTTEEVWEQVIRVNLTGVWLCMKYEIRQMLTQGRGVIVNTASIQGFIATSAIPAYTASKHGVVGLTKSAALAYAPAGIRVNAVGPGFIHTPMTERIFALYPEWEAPVTAQHPIGRMGTPPEIAEAVVWLCSDAASFVTGHTMVVDGGYLTQ